VFDRGDHLRALLAAATLSILAATAVAGAQPDAPPRIVVVAEYDGVIHPIAAEFFDNVIDRATEVHAAAVVLILRTPGGLLESTRTMVSRMIASAVPVVVYVSPAGSRAASAGFILTLAADVAAMAPGTHIGAAHPVNASGNGNDASADKAAADTAAYARTIASARKRNVDLAAAAVLESRAFTEQEAATAEPPLIDILAADLDALLARLDGREVRRFDGGTVTLHTSGAAIETVPMTRRQQLLSAIAHPQIAYLLFSLGMLGLVVELWNPGALIPGVIGGICLMLAFFAFQVVPIDVAGFLLLILGISLLVAEVTVPSFGVLGIGGIIAVVAGSIMVTDELPGVRVNYRVIVAIAIAMAVIVLGLGRLAVRAQRLAPVTGAAAMIGELGSALTPLVPGVSGQVRVHGEIWRASSSSHVAAGARVRVRGLSGLTLEVEPLAVAPSMEGDHAV
jgi:membrane-bound serine protease (ClpP class)